MSELEWNLSLSLSSMFEAAVICLVITALAAYVNHRLFDLPITIGVMIVSLAISLVLLTLEWAGFSTMRSFAERVLSSVDFSTLLLNGMLSVLLFAGALQVDLSRLHAFRWQIGVLAVVGTLVSTLVVGFGLFLLLPWLGLGLSLGYCLVFGALISPTDPIAVISILRSAGVPADVGMVMSGESLFNDGVGVVLFTLLVALASRGEAPSHGEAAIMLARDAGGGLLFGAALGAAMFVLLRSIDNYKVEVMITLAGVLGGYELARELHVSGPLAMVVAGVIIGNHGRSLAMSDTTRHHVDLFWELLDDILNAVLFVLIGLEIVMVSFPAGMAVVAAVTILLTILARWLAVGLPVFALQSWSRLPKKSWRVLTWGGLRGGISVALALSLPPGAARETVLTLTYAVVVFSIIVQGLSLRAVALRTFPPVTVL
jgi:CPA1 family monovalent cation:H+ antiporter